MITATRLWFCMYGIGAWSARLFCKKVTRLPKERRSEGRDDGVGGKVLGWESEGRRDG